MRQSLPEFDARPLEEQEWLLAVWRTQRRISVAELIESEARRKD